MRFVRAIAAILVLLAGVAVLAFGAQADAQDNDAAGSPTPTSIPIPQVPVTIFQAPVIGMPPTPVATSAPVAPPPVAESVVRSTVSDPGLAATGLANEKPLPFGQAIVGLGFAVLGMTRLLRRRQAEWYER